MSYIIRTGDHFKSTTVGALAVICRPQQIDLAKPPSSWLWTAVLELPGYGRSPTVVPSVPRCHPPLLFLNSTTDEQTFNRPLCIEIERTDRCCSETESVTAQICSGRNRTELNHTRRSALATHDNLISCMRADCLTADRGKAIHRHHRWECG